MDNLQYYFGEDFCFDLQNSFKPCYKWIIFNIAKEFKPEVSTEMVVLNLVING